MTDILKTYSVLIKWADNDAEQGNYGTVVRATGYEEAQAKARADMRENHIANHCDADDDDDEIAESCAGYEHIDNWTGATIFGGECQECAEGAIWKAAELEMALRGMVAAYGKLHDFMSDAIENGRLTEGDIPDDYQAIVSQLEACGAADHIATKLIAEIDGIA